MERTAPRETKARKPAFNIELWRAFDGQTRPGIGRYVVNSRRGYKFNDNWARDDHLRLSTARQHELPPSAKRLRAYAAEHLAGAPGAGALRRWQPLRLRQHARPHTRRLPRYEQPGLQSLFGPEAYWRRQQDDAECWQLDDAIRDKNDVQPRSQLAGLAASGNGNEYAIKQLVCKWPKDAVAAHDEQSKFHAAISKLHEPVIWTMSNWIEFWAPSSKLALFADKKRSWYEHESGGTEPARTGGHQE